MSDAELNTGARDWVTDCMWKEDPEYLEDLTDEEIRRGVNRHYDGGWQQFVQDAHGYDPPNQETDMPLREGDPPPADSADWDGDCPHTIERHVAGYGSFDYKCTKTLGHSGHHVSMADTSSGREFVAAVWSPTEADEETRRKTARAESDAAAYERDRRRFLGLDRPTPPTRTTGSTGGTGMSVNIEEARAGIMGAKSSGESGLAELSQAHSSLEDAQNGLRHSTEGSNQAEADQAHGMLAEAMQKIEEARAQVAAALQEFEGVAQRL